MANEKMTKEQAIIQLNKVIEIANPKTVEAIEMAIEVLGQEVKTAYWLPYAERDGKTVEWVCSSCRMIKSATSDRTEYCPVCGARMTE